MPEQQAIIKRNRTKQHKPHKLTTTKNKWKTWKLLSLGMGIVSKRYCYEICGTHFYEQMSFDSRLHVTDLQNFVWCTSAKSQMIYFT